MFNTNTTYPIIPVPMDSDDLVRDIYIQLLELYAYDLEVELLCEQIKKVLPLPDISPYQNPWPNNPPIWYGPPYQVTGEFPAEHHKYSDDWDAWYDPIKNEWVDSKCSDDTCEYCVNRPERPQ